MEKSSNNAKENQNNSISKISDSNTSRKEIGGPKGPEPTRYGDWERKGKCVDF